MLNLEELNTKLTEAWEVALDEAAQTFEVYMTAPFDGDEEADKAREKAMNIAHDKANRLFWVMQAIRALKWNCYETADEFVASIASIPSKTNEDETAAVSA